MPRIAIFGAGQAGAMAVKNLPADWTVLGFIDNDTEKQGKTFCGFPVMSLEEMLKVKPDRIFLTVIREDAEEEIREQIRKELKKKDFDVKIMSIRKFRRMQDLRLAELRLLEADIKEREISGAVSELGVYKGEFAREINRLFPDRKLYLFDTFTGFSEKDLKVEELITEQKDYHRDFSDTSVEMVRKVLPHPEQAVFIKGYFPDSVKDVENLGKFALVSLDPDLYEPTHWGLSFFWPRLSEGGAILIHDYTSFQFTGVRKAVDEFCEENNLYVTPLMDFHGSAVLRKQGK